MGIELQSFWMRISEYNPIVIVFELVVIWIFLYVIWRFLLGTKGIRLIKGMGLIAFSLVLILNLLNVEGDVSFDRLDFLTEHFLGIAALVIVVVLQPELRRALMQLGETRFFSL